MRQGRTNSHSCQPFIPGHLKVPAIPLPMAPQQLQLHLVLTCFPWAASEKASWQETVLFPTPPFPDSTRTMCFTLDSLSATSAIAGVRKIRGNGGMGKKARPSVSYGYKLVSGVAGHGKRFSRSGDHVNIPMHRFEPRSALETKCVRQRQ